MLEELQVEVTNCSNVPFLDADRTSTPAWFSDQGKLWAQSETATQ